MTFVLLLTSLKLRWKSSKGFHKMPSKDVFNTLEDAVRSAEGQYFERNVA